jgi:hypothetical protein
VLGLWLQCYPSTPCKSPNPPTSSTSAIDVKCAKCGSPWWLIALIETHEVIEKILVAMHLPAGVPEMHPARPPGYGGGGA